MSTKTPVVKTDIRNSKAATLTRSPRPVLLHNSGQGRVGSPRVISFGWARTATRRYGR